jgi:transposase
VVASLEDRLRPGAFVVADDADVSAEYLARVRSAAEGYISDETAKRLMTIPGVGPVTASAIVTTIQDIGDFASGREFAAFLGLTPRQSRRRSRLARRCLSPKPSRRPTPPSTK